MGLQPIKWNGETLDCIDQRYLPNREETFRVHNLNDAYIAINSMVVRGAPLIGFTAIYGLALWLRNNPLTQWEDFLEACNFLKSARPTAVNLEFEIEQTKDFIRENFLADGMITQIDHQVFDFAQEKINKLDKDNTHMAKLAEKWLSEHVGDRPLNLMTICNSGQLACGPRGTALGTIQYLGEQRKVKNVIVPETRPYLQGSRLSSYELLKYGIPHQIIVEGAFSHVLSKGMVDAIFVGADRIAANGDTANKIGTSTLAITAKAYRVPFFVVAPLSTFDANSESGNEIEIEIRAEEEIKVIGDVLISHGDAKAYNPSFDITKAELITGILCEKELILNPSKEKVKQVLGL